MQTLLLVLNVVVAALMIGLILLQQGKGADAGASFGSGASATVFGAAGAGNALTRLTAILATIFIVTTIGLAYTSKKSSKQAIDAIKNVDIPAATAPAAAPTANDIPTPTAASPAAPTVPSADIPAPTQPATAP